MIASFNSPALGSVLGSGTGTGAPLDGDGAEDEDASEPEPDADDMAVAVVGVYCRGGQKHVHGLFKSTCNWWQLLDSSGVSSALKTVPFADE